MRVAIFGTAGFIGMHTAMKLLDEGIDVCGFDNINDYYNINLKLDRLKLLNNHKAFHFVKGDIQDRTAVDAFFSDYQPTHVINLAAQAGVRYSITHPHEYINSNICGFANILEACRRQQISHLVYASSSSVYGGNTKLPFHEDNNVNHPISLYAASKKANELMAHTYSHLYNIPTTGLRFFTVYGPWGRPDMSPMLFANAIANNTPIDVFNNGKMVRDFTFIDDIVQGVVLVLKKSATPSTDFDSLNPNPSISSAPYRIFNIGGNNPIGLLEYIETIERHMGKVAIKNFLPLQPGDVLSTAASTDLLSDWIGFRPQTSLDTGIRSFVEWYKKYYNHRF